MALRLQQHILWMASVLVSVPAAAAAAIASSAPVAALAVPVCTLLLVPRRFHRRYRMCAICWRSQLLLLR